MRDWGFLPSPDELEAVTAAAKLYREHCTSLRGLPTNAAFDGSVDDVHTLDYLRYEGISPRGAGIELAALVCGEVLRRAAEMEWVISYRGDWLVCTKEDAFSELAICPLARLHEFECSRFRGYGMHMRFIQKAAFDCLPFLDGEAERKTRELFEADVEYLAGLDRTLERLGRPALQVRPKRRRR